MDSPAPTVTAAGITVIHYDLGDDLKAFGQLDYSFDPEGNNTASDSAKLEEAYVGLDFGGTTVAIGRQNLAGDEFGVEAALETHTAEDRFEQVADKGNDVIRLDTQIGDATLIASVLLGAETSANAGGEAFDILLATELAGIDWAVAYQTFNDNTLGAEDQNSWGISAAYDAGFAKLAADYSTTDTGATDKRVTNLAAKFKLSANTSSAIGVVSADEGNVDSREWYANIQHKLAGKKNINIFAELADTDQSGVDLGYLAGLQLTF